MRERQISRPPSACQRDWEPLQHNWRKATTQGSCDHHKSTAVEVRFRGLRLTRGSVGMEVDG